MLKRVLMDNNKQFELVPYKWGELVKLVQRNTRTTNKILLEESGVSAPTLVKMRSGMNRSVNALLAIFGKMGVKVFIEIPEDQGLASIIKNLNK